MASERRKDPATRDRIDELIAGTHERLDEIENGYLAAARQNRELIQQVRRRTTIILGMVVAILLAGGFANAKLISENSERVDDIQQSRADVIYNNCADQNDRNRNTVAVFDRRISDLEHQQAPAAQLRRARQSREFTVGLINALAPVQDCDRLLVKRLGPDHPVPARKKQR